MTTSTDANPAVDVQSDVDDCYSSARWFRAGGHAVDNHAAWLEQQFGGGGGGGSENHGDHAFGQQPAAAPSRRVRSRRQRRSSGNDGASTAVAGSSAAAAVRRRSRTLMRVSRYFGGLQDDVHGGETGETLCARRDEQVRVYVCVVFLKIGEIDTIKEKYGADVFVQARWREPLFDDNMHAHRPSEVTWSHYWNPRLYIDNIAADSKEQIWKTVLWKNGSEAYVFERRRVAGHFIENYDLSQFPFDTQDITLTIVSERLDNELMLLEERGELSTVNVQSFVNEQEWRLYNNVETQQQTVTRIYQDDESTHPSFTAVCHASRRYGFYVWNILFVMFFVGSMVFTSFAIDIHKTENRIQTSLVVILTTVTFKFTVNQSLPRISYLTYLDKYILSSMAMMCLICAWHALSPFISDDEGDVSDVADKIALVVFAALFFIAHISFYLFIYFAAIHPRRVYVVKERRLAVRNLEEQTRSRQRQETQATATQQETAEYPADQCRTNCGIAPEITF